MEEKELYKTGEYSKDEVKLSSKEKLEAAAYLVGGALAVTFVPILREGVIHVITKYKHADCDGVLHKENRKEYVKDFMKYEFLTLGISSVVVYGLYQVANLPESIAGGYILSNFALGTVFSGLLLSK